MKSMVFFLLLTAALLFCEEHPWPMWGHDARHTQRTGLIGMIPGGHVETFDNKAYSPTYSGVSSYRDSLIIFNTSNNLSYYQSWATEDQSIKFYASSYSLDNYNYTNFYKSSSDKWSNNGEPPLGTVCMDFDTLYFSYYNYSSYKMVVGTIDTSGNFTLLKELEGPYNGPITKANKRLYVTHRKEYEGDIYLTVNDGNDTYAWSILLETNTLGSAPAVDSTGQIYVLTKLNLYSVDKDGNISWKNPVYNTFYRFGGYLTEHSLLSQAPLISQDNMIVVTEESGLMAFNSNNGSLVWKITGKGEARAAPSELSDGTFIYLSISGVYAIDKNGNEKWHLQDPIPAYIPATIDGEDKIYICTNSPQKGIACISSAGELLGKAKWQYYFYESNENSRSTINSYPLGQAQIVKSGEIITGYVSISEYSGGSGREAYSGNGISGGYCIFNTELANYNTISKSYSPPIKLSLSCYPNPFRDKLKIDLHSSYDENLKIYDITGRCLLNKSFAKGKHSFVWKTSNKGVFILKYGKEVKKVVRIE